MLSVLTCIVVDHDLRLIVLAAIACATGCLTAFAFKRRAHKASGATRLSWLGLTGLVAGAGVWTTHFVAMLAYQPDLPIGFEFGATAGSLLIAVAGMTAGFAAPVLAQGRFVRPFGGALAGMSVAAMHFTGISAMRTHGYIVWNEAYVIAAMGIGMAFAAAAMMVAGRYRGRGGLFAASGLLIVGIVGLHFTAMTAVTLVYDPRVEMPVTLVSRTMMAFATVGLMAVILAAVAALVWVENLGRRSAMHGLHHALDAVSGGLAFFDPAGRLVSCNRAFADMIAPSGVALIPGVTRESLINAGRDAGWRAVGDEALSQAWRDHGETSAMPSSLVRMPDGRFVRHESFEARDGGGVTVMTDVTQEESFARMLTEARDSAEAATRAKSRFLANISHEIRTPLNGILGLTDVLAASDLPPKQQEAVRIIQSSGALLNSLLTDLLDLAKAEAGATELHPEPQGLQALMQSVVNLYSTRAEQKGLTLSLELEGVEAEVACDGTRLRQVMGNLVSNAIKFTETGSVTLSARRRGDQVMFAVTDTGVGIDKEFREHLFGRFQQADDSETRRHGGAGLGLAICKEYVGLMGGALDWNSEPGAGSHFFFTLDLPPLAATEAIAAPAEAEHTGPFRVLVVDDNAVNRQVLGLILDAGGIEHHHAIDGAEAVEAARSTVFDAILMDIQMPVMDGLEATRRIRDIERGQHRRRIPIIIVSANGLQEHVDAGMAAGADGHLTKPITPNQILGALAPYAEAMDAAMPSAAVH